MSQKEKDRRKEQQDKFQAILSALLKDDDNKYCVDCDAKGPRWASWNLGIFLCIRCAGIHRNLGVHISKVKSVNLDTWTPEQVAMMQEIGNSRARAAYEANLPDGYRRPQTDSALEAFIRSKYETKKYMAREWVPPQPKVPKEWLEEKSEKKKAKPKAGSVQLTNIPKPSQTATESVKSQPQKVELPKPKAQAPVSSANDLLGLDLGKPQSQQPPAPAPSSSGGNDLLEMFGGPRPNAQAAPAAQPQQQPAQENVVNGSSAEANLFGEDLSAANGEKKASTKDSIMALFGGAPTSQPQMYGVPGSTPQYYPTQDTSCNANYSAYFNGPYGVQMVGMYSASMPYPQMGPAAHHNHIIPLDFANAANQLSEFDQTVAPFRASGNAGQPLPVYSSTVIGNCPKLKPPPSIGQKASAKQQGHDVITQKNYNAQQGQQQPVVVPPPQGGPWAYYAPNGHGGVYLPQGQSQGQSQGQGQQMYPNMMGQQQQGNQQVAQGMMGNQQQANMMGNQQQANMIGNQQQANMMGNQQAQGMMGNQQGNFGMQPQGMMGNQQMQGMMGNQQPQQGMMGNQQPQQGMMGNQPQGMMGNQPQGMMGNQQQGMMGQMPGMMGNPTMNGSQPGMFAGQQPGMAGNAGMYTPQQMQQLQFQQMQQQMSSMKMGQGQMGGMPQQMAAPAQAPGGWGQQAAPAGQTLSTNLWQ